MMQTNMYNNLQKYNNNKTCIAPISIRLFSSATSEEEEIDQMIEFDCSSKESKYLTFPQVNTASIKRDTVPKV